MTKAKRWTYDAASGKFRCVYPGCAYTHADPGGITLHAVRAHEGKGGKQAKQPAAAAGCEHTFALLDRSMPAMAAALASGYAAYCQKCFELK